MTLPKFSVEQDWSESGDVDVWFGGNVDNGVQEYVAIKLADITPHMNKEERCVHHLTNVISDTFRDMIDKKEIRHSSVVNRWMLSKEVD